VHVNCVFPTQKTMLSTNMVILPLLLKIVNVELGVLF